MKALLFSIGTRGDVEPFLAIAGILKARDWDVVCVFPEQFRNSVEPMGLPFYGFSREFLELLENKDAKMFMGAQGSLVKRTKLLISLAKQSLELMKGILDLHHRVQKAENPDKVLYHPKCYYSLIWGMANPGRSILISPVPGVCHPIDHLTLLGDYGKPLNKLSYWLQNTLKALMLKKYSKRYREDYPDLKITMSAIKKAMLEKEKTLYTISPSLFHKPEYWPSSAHVVGYYERDKSVDWKASESLTEFIEQNENIVFITFGSMTSANPRDKTRIIVDVLARNRIPAIINTSWGGLEAMNNPPCNVCFVSGLPYDWLFPKMRAIIHHGGSGTTHTALKYGRPSLIIPHILDQHIWGDIVSRLGLGPKGVPINKLNHGVFENKLLDLLNNDDYKSNAELIAQKMKIESDEHQLYELIASEN